MSENRSTLVTVAGVVLGSIALWALVHYGWYKPRADVLHDELESARERVEGYRSTLDRNPRLQRQFDELVTRTLGGDVETVDHRLRTRLNRIAEQLELAGPTVTTGRPSSRTSPARLAFPASLREIRDEIDFVEVEGSISAEGTLMQIVSLVDRIEAEQWIKRINSLRLDPSDNGERFSVSLRLTTLFLPDREAEHLPTEPYEPQRLERFASLVESNPFRLPPPPQPAQPQQQNTPQPAPAERWVITGIATGPDGAEAWLRNARSGEARVVTIGQDISGAVLVAARDETAEFEINQERLTLTVGQTLSPGR